MNLLPAKITPADSQMVFDAGWDEEALFEAIEVCGVFNLMNRLVEGGGVNFSYADDPNQHTVQSGDDNALKDSYLRYGERIAELVAAKT